MNKRELASSMERSIGAFPTVTAIRQYMGWGKTRTAEFLRPLDYIDGGKTKQYYVGDIAERLMQERKM